MPLSLTGPDGSGGLSLSGAAGSIMTTSGISVTEGGRLMLNYALGNSAANTRVSTGTAISTTGGFIEVLGNAGVVTQSLGTLTAGGLTTVLAGTTGAAGFRDAGHHRQCGARHGRHVHV